MKLCLLAICLLVIIVTVSADGGGKGKGKGGMMKHMKKWKWCGEIEAKYDNLNLKEKWEDCKKENPKPEEENEGESGEESGDKPKKHEHMKKMHDCVTKKLGIVKEDGSVDSEKVKEGMISVYGAEVGAKLGDKIITDCAEKMAAAKEGEGKWKVWKCLNEVRKEVCGDNKH